MTLHISQNSKVPQIMLSQNSSQSFAGDLQEYQPEDNSKLKTGVVVGLAIAAAVGIGFLAKKPQKVTNVISDVTNEVAEGVSDKIKKPITNNIKRLKKQNKPTRNLSKKLKKIFRQQARSQREAKLAEQIKTEKTSQELNEKISSVARKANNGNQGLAHAKSIEKVDEMVNKSSENLQKAKEYTEKLKNNAQELGTSKANKDFQRAQNRVNEAELKHQKLIEQANKQKNKLEQQAIKKAENVAKNQASPNYETGQIKQMLNADITMENSLWKEMYNTKKGSPEDKLKRVINNPKAPEAKKELAKKWLAEWEAGRIPQKTSSNKSVKNVVIPELSNAAETSKFNKPIPKTIIDAEEVPITLKSGQKNVAKDINN